MTSPPRRVYIWQDPGNPPQRPHMGASSPPPSEPADFAEPELTAKTLSARAVLSEPQAGQAAFALSAFIERARCSNFVLHAAQVYS